MAATPHDLKCSKHHTAAVVQSAIRQPKTAVPIAIPVRPGPGHAGAQPTAAVRPAPRQRDWKPIVAGTMMAAGSVLMCLAAVFALLPARGSVADADARSAPRPGEQQTASPQPGSAVSEPSTPTDPPTASSAPESPLSPPPPSQSPAPSTTAADLLAHTLSLPPEPLAMKSAPVPAPAAADPLAHALVLPREPLAVGIAPMPVPTSEPAVLSEQELEEQLAAVTEIDLPKVNDVRAQEMEYAQLRGRGRKFEVRRDPGWETGIAGTLNQLLKQAHAAGLPMRSGTKSVLPQRAANALARGAIELHLRPGLLAGTSQETYMTTPVIRNAAGTLSMLDRRSGRTVITIAGLPRSRLRSAADLRNLFEVVWPREKVTHDFNVVPVLVQVLQVENADYRRLLIEELGRVPGTEASVALAKRALYDTAPELRDAAVKLLKARPAAQYRNVVLEAFRYPWPPVADHAADLLLRMRDGSSVELLKTMLAERDPALPYLNEKTKKYEVRELVSLNHMRNCCLCHPPSYTETDWVPGRVMDPARPIPVEYYGNSTGAFIHAEITYLQQDFSCLKRVINPRPWPERQRYDYLLRTRQATPEEVATLKHASPTATYPQREAILRVLRHITDPQLADATAPRPKE